MFSSSGVFGGEIVKTRVRDDTDAAPQPGSLQAGQGCWRLLPSPLGIQRCFKNLEVTTHIEPVKEVICWVLVLHEQLQVLEHLKRRRGWPWSGTRSKFLPDISICRLTQIDSVSDLRSTHPTTSPTFSTSRAATGTSKPPVPQAVFPPISAIPGSRPSKSSIPWAKQKNKTSVRTVQVLTPTSQLRMLQQEAELLSRGSWARTTLKAPPQSFSPFFRTGSGRVHPHHPALLHLTHMLPPWC